MVLTKRMKQMLYFIATELDWGEMSSIELTQEDNKQTVKALVNRGFLEPEDEVAGDAYIVQLTEAGLQEARKLDITKEPYITSYITQYNY